MTAARGRTRPEEDGEAPEASPATLRVLTKVCAITAATIGAAVIAGWLAGVDRLTRLQPGLASMKFNTALCLTLLGAAWTASRRGLSMLLCAPVALIAGVTALEYATGRDLGVDELFHAGDPRVVHGGRMAFTTASCLLLLAVGHCAAQRRWYRANSIAAGLVILVAALAVMGYAFGSRSLYEIGPFSTMALHAAVALLLLGVAGLAAEPAGALAQALVGQDAGSLLLRRLLPVAFVGLPVLGYVRLWGQRAGLYDTIFGLAMMVVFAALMVAAVASLAARELRVIDRARSEVAARLQNLNSELETRVAARTAQLESAYADLESANARLDEFNGVVAHDIKGPLTVLSAIAQILGSRPGDLPANSVGLLEDLNNATLQLGAMVDDLLAYSRAAAVPIGPVDLGAVVAAATARLQSRLTGIGATVNYEQPLPFVVGNGTALTHVVVNLLENAVKYHNPEEPLAVDIAAHVEGDRCRLIIADNGIGIPEDQWTAVFSAGTRLAPRAAPGLGLGLAAVQVLVERHGGTVWVSEPSSGRGAQFSIDLPAVVSEAPEMAERPHAHEGAADNR